MYDPYSTYAHACYHGRWSMRDRETWPTVAGEAKAKRKADATELDATFCMMGKINPFRSDVAAQS